MDRTPFTTLTLLPGPTDAHPFAVQPRTRTAASDRSQSQPERVQCAVQGGLDAPKPVRRPPRLTRCQDGRAAGEPQILRRVLQHIGVGTGRAARAGGPGLCVG